ncbi:IS1182 family transposase [Shouchella clausii]|uniref:IS1182 family transposase n=2 Tax=Shouchella clausii TaxID=79880 RepID=UPI002ACEA82F|nr:IS1182 family transposase [Shouchella clausii]
MRNPKVTFQEYTMNQLYLPMDFSDLIPEHHVARVVSDVVDGLDDDFFVRAYEGGGRPAYHPKMMTKIVLYAYTQRWFSCRAMGQALKENLPMMWLAAGQAPNFRTINRFRSERFQSLMEGLYTEMTHLLIEEGYVDMEAYFLDGTKIEANANKYSFVWKKSTLSHEEKLQMKIDKTLEAIQEAITLDTETLKQEDATFERQRISRKRLQDVVTKVEKELDALDQAIAEAPSKEEKRAHKEASKPLRKAYRSLTKDHLPRLEKYEEQMGLFGERNSFSKTDPDATFMRMKDDHMNNGQLKAGYNWQVATQNQFILHYTVHQHPTDIRCLIPHYEHLKATGLPLPNWFIADAGYGSESNYLYMEEQETVTSLIPYITYRQEQKRSFPKQTYHPYNWWYDEHEDVYWCPNNRKVAFKAYRRRTDRYGFKRDFKIYECESCEGCPFKADCTKAKGNRQIHYNPVYEELKAKEAAKLHSERGATLYAQRKTDVESVFGHAKQNLGFRRFHLRGLEKVTVELGWLGLALNLRKMAGKACHYSLKTTTHQKKGSRDQLKSRLPFFILKAFGTTPVFWQTLASFVVHLKLTSVFYQSE